MALGIHEFNCNNRLSLTHHEHDCSIWGPTCPFIPKVKEVKKKRKKLSTHAEGDEGKGNIFNEIKICQPIEKEKEGKKRKSKRLFTHSKGEGDWKCIKKRKKKRNQPFQRKGRLKEDEKEKIKKCNLSKRKWGLEGEK